MSRLSKNIKSLRKYTGETQEDLAYSIGLDSKSAVANWESGANKPSPDNLKEIAAHYRVTVDQLLEDDFDTDFSMLEFLNNAIDENNYDLNYSFVCLFPIVSLKGEEELYPRLIEAKSFYKKFQDCTANGNEKSIDYLLKAIEIYGEIEETSNCISAKANVLSLWFFFLLMLKSGMEFEGIEDILEVQNKHKRKKEIKRVISENYLGKSIESLEKLRTFVYEDYYKDLLEFIMELKGDKRLFQLGDYYYCLLYLFDLVDNELGTAVNTQIGSALLSDLSLMKNRLVKRIKNYFRILGKVQ